MKTNTSLFVGVLIGLVLGLVFSPLFGSFGEGRYMNMMGFSSRESVMRNSIDRHFIEQMIPHHEGAIEMAKLALEKSRRQEVKTLAQNIISAQEKEINDMKGWYKEWFGTDVPVQNQHGMSGDGHMHMDGMSGDLSALTSAQNFDREFVRQMIVHHEMAVMMAQMLQSSTDRLEMKQLAKNIITSQSDEIQMMKNWQNTILK